MKKIIDANTASQLSKLYHPDARELFIDKIATTIAANAVAGEKFTYVFDDENLLDPIAAKEVEEKLRALGYTVFYMESVEPNWEDPTDLGKPQRFMIEWN